MATEGTKRKLAAILSADVKEYSRLMSQDERGTIRALTAYKEAMSSLIQEYKGRVVDAPGDNLLAEFASVVDAVNCAVEIQRELAEKNSELPYNRRMEFRIGINIGDIVEEEKRIYGNGVNIAARVEGLAEGGGICISGKVYEEVKNKLGLEYEFLGEQEVKNIAEPVPAYRVLSFPGAAAHRVVKAKKAVGRSWRNTIMVIVAVLVVGAAVAIWNSYLRPQLPTEEVASVEKMAFSLPDKPSIAVLPFDNLSDDPKQEYFVDGMTDDLITDLSKISGLFVIARNSTFTYKGKPVRIRQVAEELAVRYVLEGSVRKADAKVRINAQLIDATTGKHLWAERYDGKLDDVFKLQDKITHKIVSALAVKLTASEKEQTARDYTDNLEAYDYYLQGKQLLNKRSREATEMAKAMFKKAIDLDPEFALAYAEHARANVIRSRMYYGGGESEAFEFVSRALVIDESLPEAYTVLAPLQVHKRLYDEAITSAAKAVAFDPSKADTYLTQAEVLTYAGRHDEALKAVNVAFRLNPKAPPYYEFVLGMVQFSNRQYAQAIESFKKAEKGMPDFVAPWFGLAPSYAYLGRLNEAKAEIKKILGAYPWYNLTSCQKLSLYKLKEDTEHRVEGFRIAGLPRVAYGHKQKPGSSSK